MFTWTQASDIVIYILTNILSLKQVIETKKKSEIKMKTCVLRVVPREIVGRSWISSVDEISLMNNCSIIILSIPGAIEIECCYCVLIFIQFKFHNFIKKDQSFQNVSLRGSSQTDQPYLKRIDQA